MKTKYMQGPWKVTPGHTLLHWRIVNSDGLHIADTIDTTNRSKPNANLIAAAPELLEACRYGAHLLRRMIDTSNTNDAALEKVFGILQDAITKAEDNNEI